MPIRQEPITVSKHPSCRPPRMGRSVWPRCNSDSMILKPTSSSLTLILRSDELNPLSRKGYLTPRTGPHIATSPQPNPPGYLNLQYPSRKTNTCPNKPDQSSRSQSTGILPSHLHLSLGFSHLHPSFFATNHVSSPQIIREGNTAFDLYVDRLRQRVFSQFLTGYLLFIYFFFSFGVLISSQTLSILCLLMFITSILQLNIQLDCFFFFERLCLVQPITGKYLPQESTIKLEGVLSIFTSQDKSLAVIFPETIRSLYRLSLIPRYQLTPPATQSKRGCTPKIVVKAEPGLKQNEK